MTALNLPPLSALLRLCPLSAIQALLIAFLTGEVSTLTQSFNVLTKRDIALLLLNSTLALAQNIVSFHTNKVAGPLTMTVCANLKQVATIVLGVVTFRTEVSCIGGIGMAMAMASSAWYSGMRLMGKGTGRIGGKDGLPK